MNKLKKCPFCGSKATYRGYEQIEGDYYVHIIDCDNCLALMEYWANIDEDQEKNKKEIIESWNQRYVNEQH